MRCGTGSGLPRIECGPPEPISSNLVESCEWLSCWISHGIGVSLHGCPGRIGHKPRVTWNRAQLSRYRLIWWNHVNGYPAGFRTVLGSHSMAVPAVSGTNQG